MEREDSSDAASPDTDASEWRFGDEQFEADADAEAGLEQETERRGSVAGGTDRRLPVEPEPVSLESALFVLLGVVVTLAVFAQFVVG
jgi:hypothetical protein